MIYAITCTTVIHNTSDPQAFRNPRHIELGMSKDHEMDPNPGGFKYIKIGQII